MEEERLDWSSHARQMLIERGISEEWVHRVLAAPERMEADPNDPDLAHALARIPERGRWMLRIVYNRSVTPWRIVTVFFDRRAGRQS